MSDPLYLGIDGGRSGSMARLTDASGLVLGEGRGGPADIGQGIEDAFDAVLDATAEAMAAAGLGLADLRRTRAGIGLVGVDLAKAERYLLPFQRKAIGSDALIACLGAHAGRDGGVVLQGNGARALARLDGRTISLDGDDAARLIHALAEAGVTRITLLGDGAAAIRPRLPAEMAALLVEPQGDALDGALILARSEPEDRT